MHLSYSIQSHLLSIKGLKGGFDYVEHALVNEIIAGLYPDQQST